MFSLTLISVFLSIMMHLSERKHGLNGFENFFSLKMSSLFLGLDFYFSTNLFLYSLYILFENGDIHQIKEITEFFVYGIIFLMAGEAADGEVIESKILYLFCHSI